MSVDSLKKQGKNKNVGHDLTTGVGLHFHDGTETEVIGPTPNRF